MSGEEASEHAQKRYEVISGLTLAVLAAVLAVADLGAGKYGDDEIIGTNEKASAYAWYQAKSLKQTVIEQQRGLLSTLESAGAISEAAKPAVDQQIADMEREIERYKKEKAEIMDGSEAVGPDGQVLEINGQKGFIIGAKVWEAKLAILGSAGDQFDLSTLFLQLCLVVGAIGLVLQAERLRWIFYGVMVVLGAVGAFYAVGAYQIAWTAG